MELQRLAINKIIKINIIFDKLLNMNIFLVKTKKQRKETFASHTGGWSE